MEEKEFFKYFDHTILKATTTREALLAVCEEAKRYGFCAVAVNTAMIPDCAAFLAGSDVRPDAAVGFPLGITSIACKLREAEEAIANGAQEIDYVIHIGKIKEGDVAYIRDEMEQIVGLCRQKGVVSKVIFENCYLTDEEKIALCEIANAVRPDFIKTSTGFGPSSATVEDVALMRKHADPAIRVKAAGGIRDLKTCLSMIEAGADRIGCSCCPAIAEEYKNNF
ncbi:MAG: deoxyribose-phosphate aldolase [Clostridia bacterium]|nr:deoxyribose-phosphate aldolase [Clostridia bacterium]